MTGTAGQKRLPKDFLQANPFPLPPFAEQHRIVAKVDELMALCDRLESEQADSGTAHARLVETLLGTLTQSADSDDLAANWQLLAAHFDTLFATEAGLDALKQSILQLAVMGKLVPQDPKDEPAIDSVKAARKTSELPISIDQFDAENLRPFELPEFWSWVTLSDVADSRLGKMLDKQKNRGQAHPYLRNTNVHWFHFQLDSIKTMLFDVSELQGYLVESGDVLICEGGHGIARSAVWDGQLAGITFQKALHRVRPLPCLNAHFLTFCLRVYEHAGILERYYTGAGIPHFTGKALARVVLPLPPLAEQHRIVAKVDELMALCDQLKADLVESRSRQARLADTLIAAALEAA
jgi:type I restriction enzyme S subunit